MQKTIISDTSCLILLDKIGELNLLHRLFGTISITPEINEEYHFPLPDWIIVESPTNKIYQKISEFSGKDKPSFKSEYGYTESCQQLFQKVWRPRNR